MKDPLASGATSEEWTSYVEYELLQISGWNTEVRWRQVTLQQYDRPLEDRNLLQEPLIEPDRGNWEVNAVAILAPALKTRRWIAQPGVFRIEVAVIRDGCPHSNSSNQPKKSKEAVKPFHAAPAVSEVDFDADGEIVTGDSTPKFESRAVLGNPAAVIPGTENFDDIPALLQDILPRADPFDGDRHKLTGQRVGKRSPTNKPWATREQIASWTKRRSSETISAENSQVSQVSMSTATQSLSRSVGDSDSD